MLNVLECMQKTTYTLKLSKDKHHSLVNIQPTEYILFGNNHNA